MKAKRASKSAMATAQPNPEVLTTDLRELILSARQTVARGINSSLVLLYWHVGQRLRTEVLKVERAEYGKEILSTMSKELVAEFGRGFSWPNLSRMMALAEAFPEQQIVATLSRELGWSHFVELLTVECFGRASGAQVQYRAPRITRHNADPFSIRVLSSERPLDAPVLGVEAALAKQRPRRRMGATQTAVAASGYSSGSRNCSASRGNAS